jgi:predicted RND superfamily exporter protein
MAIRFMSFSFIPAVLMLVPEKRLHGASLGQEGGRGLGRLPELMGRIATRRPGIVLGAALALLAMALIGIPRIRINNNMVNWFKPSSELRTADRIMNEKLGGTSLLYIVADGGGVDALKEPSRLRYVEALQADIGSVEGVGKVTSVVDLLKRMNAVILEDGRGPETLPDSRELVGQYLFLFGMSAKASTLDNLIDPGAERVNIWVQLKTWDAVAVEQVVDRLAAFTRENAAPGLTFQPAGIAYFNLVWNHEVLQDMVKTFFIALVVVLLILTFSFRSIRWGLVSFVPLLFTIVLIYGAIGHVGKDFDMPISVLSTLSLGMAVDFAIHFIRRYRQRLAEGHAMEDALLWTVNRPGKGILRNAALFSLAFAVMIASSLTPYITVGVFILSMMMLSALFTLLLLPALLVLFGRGRVRAPAPEPAGR